jgi:DNA-binding CsgD family transcriptional regulator
MPTFGAAPEADRRAVASGVGALLDRSKRGERVVATINGDAGHGKTTLLDTIARSPEAGGHARVRIRGGAPDRAIPYAGLHALIARNIGLLGDAGSPATRLLLRILTDFTPPSSPLAMCAALTDWLDCLAPDAPVLVMIDDADLVDEESLRVLAFAAAHEPPGRIAVVLTGTGRVPLIDRVATQRFHLDDLLPADACALVEGAGIALTTQQLLLRRLGGNPLALVATSRAIAEGAVDDITEPFSLPERLEHDVAERLAPLERPLLNVLELCAVTGESRHDLLDAWSTDAGTRDLVGSAEDVGLVESDGRELRWRRPWMAEVVAHRCPPGRRRRLRHEARVALTPDLTAAPTRVQPSSVSLLTASERRVAEVILAGNNNRQAAAALSLSEKTVESHLQSIYRKLDVHSRSQLAAALLRELTERP